jgi:hypothetical protein
MMRKGRNQLSPLTVDLFAKTTSRIRRLLDSPDRTMRHGNLRYAAGIELLKERGHDVGLEKRIKSMERAMKNLLTVVRQPQQELRLTLQKLKLEIETEKLRLLAGRPRRRFPRSARNDRSAHRNPARATARNAA